jgi:hypothetical protein
LESDYFPASVAIYAVDPLESRRSQFIKMAESIAKEQWEVVISGSVDSLRRNRQTNARSTFISTVVH